MKVTVDHVLNPEHEAYCSKTGRWWPTRPIEHRFESALSRLRNAIGVLRGRYDAIDWEARR